MAAQYDGHNYPPPQPEPHRHPSSSSTTKKPKQKRPSFSAEPNSAQGIRAFSACRNCRNKKIKCQPGPAHSGATNAPPLAQSPSSLENPGAYSGPCQQCLQAGIECIYPPTRDRAAYSRQYVANLETRVQSLETIQARLMPLLEAYEAGSRDGRLLRLPSPHRVGPRAPQGPASEVEEDNMEGGSDDPPGTDTENAGQITQDDRGNYRWIGSSNTLSLLDSFSDHPPSRPSLSRSQTQSNMGPSDPNRPPTPDTVSLPLGTPVRESNPYFGPVAGSGVVQALPSVEDVQYPAREKALEMVDAFFQEVYPCLPVVLEHAFRRDFKTLMDVREKGEPSWAGGFISVVFAIFALGDRAIATKRAWQRETMKAQGGDTGHETVLPGEAEAGVIWYERAQILHYTTLKDVNIHQVQCLTLLAAFQAGVNAMPMSWLLAGQAIRVAQDLGLHRSTARLPVSFEEKQLRSRCWWAVYGLERMMSISLGRPLGVDDLDVDVAYPAEIDDAALAKIDSSATATPADLEEEPESSTMSGFVALTKLCRIAGRVVHLLYRPSGGRSVSDQSWAVAQQNAINKLDKLLRDWLENDVPSKYKDPSETHSISLLSAILSNSYFTILITLHRNFLPSSSFYPRPKPPPSSQSLAHCVDAARSVIHIASNSRTLIPPSHHLAVFCQYLWSSAVILLLCEVQAKEDVVIEAVAGQVDACRRCLQALEPVWPGAAKLKALLNDVASRAKEVVVKPPTGGKKRKLSRDRDREREREKEKERYQMAPPAVGPEIRPTTSPRSQQIQQSWLPNPHTQAQAHAMGHTHTHSGSSTVASGPPPEKRPRIYESPDGRAPDDSSIVPLPIPNQPQPTTQTQAYCTIYPHSLSTSTSSRPLSTPGSAHSLPMLPARTHSISQVQGQGEYQPYDTFDLGGVNFEGLELLQGFGGQAWDFWNNFTFGMDEGRASNTAPSGDGVYGGSGAGTGSTASNGTPYIGDSLAPTPNSNGPGPSSWQGPTMGGIPQQQGYPTPGGVLAPGGQEVAAYWEEVVGGGFDWQADPNVPFNI